MSLSETIAKAIQENLPAATAAELSKFITSAEQKSKALEQSIDALAKKEKEIEQLKEKVVKLEKEVRQEEAFADRQKALTEAENNLKVSIAELRVVEAEKRADMAKDLVGMVFRSPRHITKENGTAPTQSISSNSNGNYYNSYPSSQPYERTTEITQD